MKNTNKLLVVVLALAIAVSSIVVTTLTTSAATEVNPYEEVLLGSAATDYDKEGHTDASADKTLTIETDSTHPNFGGVGNTFNGAWLKYENVAFGDNGATKVTIKYGSKAARMAEDAKAEIWVDGKSAAEGGTLVATVDLPVPEDREADYVYGMTSSADLATAVTGTKTMYVVLSGTTDTNADEYIANLSTILFTEAATEGNEATGIPTLGETNQTVLFYTDFSDVSDLVVRKTTVNNWPNHESDEIVNITLDEDGHMVMAKEEYISLGADLLAGKTDMTIEFVVNPSAIVEHAAFAGIGRNLPNIDEATWVVMGMRADGAVKFGMKSNDVELGAGDDGKTAAGLLAVGTWTKIKYEFTEETVKLFVNDVELKSWDATSQKTLAELAEIENEEFIFGKEMRWGDEGFSGTVSEIRVTTTAGADSNNGGSSDDSTTKPVTGDVASVAAILAAGVAALGALKLKKKSK